MSHLFDSLKLRDLFLPNRIGMSPMCQYSAENGVPNDWHFVHYGTRAVGGVGLMIVEATGVAPEGRISRGDLGLWDDGQIDGHARIVQFAKERGCVTAIQLAHAGRKASNGLGWEPAKSISEKEGGWPLLAPSAISFGEGHAVPHELDKTGILKIIEQFVGATRRARQAGYQVVEVHAAHGYLLHEFLSPLSNQRNDAYGGSLENRSRLLREIVARVRSEWPQELPVFVRLSATDWVEGGWDIEQTIKVCRMLKELGVDLVDISSAGLVPTAEVPAGPGFQTEFASRVRQEAGIPTATVGMITSAAQADHIIRSGQADLVLLGRELLRNPYWALDAAKRLGKTVSWPLQYLRSAPAGSSGR